MAQEGNERNRIQELFLAALQIPDHEREPWLVEQCSGDPELLNHVRSLLSYDNPHQDPLEDGLEHAIADLPAEIRTGRERRSDEAASDVDDTVQAAALTGSGTEFLDRLEALGELGISEIALLREQATARGDSLTAQQLASRLVETERLTPYQAQQLIEPTDAPLRLGNYTILDELGRGGMGQVYLARHRRMRRQVAIKILPPESLDSPDMLDRFQREVEAAAKLNHPNVVAAHDADEADGIHFLVMEYVDGRDLGSLVKEQGPLDVSDAVGYVVQAAQGLAAAHQAGVIHRDVKPSNLIVDGDGTVKVVDFGLARLQSSTRDHLTRTRAALTHTSTLLGTVDFLAPEQARNIKHADHRADIYSLGCTLYFLLSAKPMFPGKSMMAKVTAHQKQPPPSIAEIDSEIPAALEDAYQRMVAKEPSDRFQSMEDVIEALRSFVNVDDTSVAARDATAVTRLQHSGANPPGDVSQKRAGVLLGIVSAVVLIAASSWAVFRSVTTNDDDNPTLAENSLNAAGNQSEPDDQPTPTPSDTETTNDTQPLSDAAGAESPNAESPSFESSGARVLRVGPVTGMLSTLEDAIAAAESGDVIEIHTNEPLIMSPVVWRKGDLTIRAGKNYVPILTRAQGKPGNLLSFRSPDIDREIQLQELAIVDFHTERHTIINTKNRLRIDRCLLIGSGGIYCDNPVGAQIANSYLSTYLRPTRALYMGGGRLTLENNLFVRGSVGLGSAKMPTVVTANRNTFVHDLNFHISNPDLEVRIDATGNLNYGLRGLMHIFAATAPSADKLTARAIYSGNNNLFFQTPYRLLWGYDQDGEYREQTFQSDDFSVLEKLSGDGESDSLPADPLFADPGTVRLARQKFVPASAFQMQPSSPASANGIGADLSKLPTVPPELYRVLPPELLGPGVPAPPTVIRVGPEDGMVATLAEAFDIAEDGNVIEIHTNQPLMIEPGTLDWTKGTLTIQAGEGYFPILARQGQGTGWLFRFKTNQPNQVYLQGLTIVDFVDDGLPTVVAFSEVSVDQCNLILPNAIFCRNAAAMRISNSYFANFWNAKNKYSLHMAGGRLELENNLFLGSRVALGMDQVVTDAYSHRNTFMKEISYEFTGPDRPTKLTASENLYYGLSCVAKVFTSDAQSTEDFQQQFDYSGSKNLFFRTPLGIRWSYTSGGEYKEDLLESRDLSAWQEFTENQEQEPLLIDPGFGNPSLVQSAFERLVPSSAFQLKPDSVAARQGIGADLSKLPPLPPELHQVLPKEIFDAGK